MARKEPEDTCVKGFKERVTGVEKQFRAAVFKLDMFLFQLLFKNIIVHRLANL